MNRDTIKLKPPSVAAAGQGRSRVAREARDGRADEQQEPRVPLRDRCRSGCSLLQRCKRSARGYVRPRCAMATDRFCLRKKRFARVRCTKEIAAGSHSSCDIG